MSEIIISKNSSSVKEEWKPVEGFEGIYDVSSEGRVKRVKNGANNILKPFKNKKGYLGVDLHDCGRRLSAKIHRLVAIAFIPNPMGYLEINHKDENKANNAVSNLEWCTRQYNVKYGTGAKRGIDQLKKVVCQYNYDGELIKKWPSAKELSRELGLDCACIVRCCNGIMKTFHGYIWVYEEDEDREDKIRKKIEWIKDGRNSRYGRERPIARYTLEGEFVDSFQSVREAERKTECHSSCIVKSIKKGTQSGGYIWKYQD